MSETTPEILVTGTNGFTGHEFAAYLLEKGETIRAHYYGPDGRPDLPGDRVELISGDIRNRSDVQKMLEGIKTVYHIAALYRPANVTKKDFWDVNVEGTRHMVEEAAKAGVQSYVHCSTIGVHGTVGREPANEDAPIQPDDVYQESKWEGEKLAKKLATELQLRLAVIRPAAIYGPRERRFLKLTQLINNRRLIMFGSGDPFYHFINVRDLSAAFVLAAQTERSNGQSYIIADDHAITLEHLVATFAKALGVPPPRIKLPYFLLYIAAVLCEGICKPFGINPPVHRRRASFFVSDRTFDISKARNELGYEPKVRIEDGIEDMVASYKEAGWVN